MDPWTTPERLSLRKMVADFTEKEIVPHLPRWEEDGEIPRRLHEQAAELGLRELLRESEVEHHYRDARLLGIGGGANEVMNEIIAKNLNLDTIGSAR
ncbi:acyl-CoA dehydrogenase family protein [Amycolatopsis lurida]|uniref:acyl-CoA dehydrogenase family protein n=1 Tax=Amycolatopsis lurida TaxID=31959 RepID=UPI003645FC62